MIRMRGERHLLREEWVEDVEGKDKDLDGDLWKKKKLLLRKEWFEDVEGKDKDLDGDLWKKKKTFTQERMV